MADFQQLADENDDYRYLLVGVDVLSRRCFAVPVHSKESEEMKKGFEELFKQMPNLPSEIFSDNGREFESREMRKYFAKKGISKFSSNRGEQKAAVAERFIRTIKDRLYRYFSEKNTTRYIEAVPKIIEGLNNTVNTATGIAPNEVTAEMTKKLWDRLYKDALLPNQSPKNTRYKAGDAVRMSKGKRTFDKRYERIIAIILQNILAIGPDSPTKSSRSNMSSKESQTTIQLKTIRKSRFLDDYTRRNSRRPA